MRTEAITISMPLPPPELHPNRPVHPLAKARHTRAARDRAFYLATAMLGGRGKPYWTKVQIQIRWYFTVHRRRDEKNLDGWLKAYVDGLVDAGIMIDDNPDVVTWAPTEIHITKGTAAVLFIIKPINGQATQDHQ
jgi:crossover junction endodeoxyribonuclease RusA